MTTDRRLSQTRLKWRFIHIGEVGDSARKIRRQTGIASCKPRCGEDRVHVGAAAALHARNGRQFSALFSGVWKALNISSFHFRLPHIFLAAA